MDPYGWLAEGGLRSRSEDALRRLVKLVESLDDVTDVTALTACLGPDERR